VADQFKPTYADAVIDAMARGFTQQAAAAEIGFCRDTLRAWAKTHPEMERALKIGQAKRVLYLEQAHLTIMVTGIGNIAGSIFALKNADPEEWRDGPPPPPPLPAGAEVSDLVLAQRLAYILSRAMAGAGANAKLIEGHARPNGAGAKNGHG
jgi:hypothetical protein